MNDLECLYTEGGVSPSASQGYYEFEIVDSCGLMLLQTFNCNGDSQLCALDMVAWASNPRDFNGDSSADATDLVILENAIDMWNSD